MRPTCSFLVPTSPTSKPVRKAHNSGRNHLANVRDYYACSHLFLYRTLLLDSTSTSVQLSAMTKRKASSTRSRLPTNQAEDHLQVASDLARNILPTLLLPLVDSHQWVSEDQCLPQDSVVVSDCTLRCFHAFSGHNSPQPVSRSRQVQDFLL